MDKRYQVFISSTYADLREERQRVFQTLMELDCIPAGMELFPAADEEQFEFIKRIIDDCDYYLLIIGGRYGSVTSEGISYTEKEYDYAVSKGIKVVAILHENQNEIPAGKTDQDPEKNEKLQSFRQKVENGRMVKFWGNSAELPGVVALSLLKTIKMYPAIGWVRANKSSSEDILSEINTLRKENALLQEKITKAELTDTPCVENIAGLDEEIELHCSYMQDGKDYDVKLTATWGDIFGIISPYLLRFPDDYAVRTRLVKGLLKGCASRSLREKISEKDYETVSVQLRALGLVKLDYSANNQEGRDVIWSLTPAGEKLMLELRAIPSKKPQDGQ